MLGNYITSLFHGSFQSSTWIIPVTYSKNKEVNRGDSNRHRMGQKIQTVWGSTTQLHDWEELWKSCTSDDSEIALWGKWHHCDAHYMHEIARTGTGKETEGEKERGRNSYSLITAISPVLSVSTSASWGGVWLCVHACRPVCESSCYYYGIRIFLKCECWSHLGV